MGLDLSGRFRNTKKVLTVLGPPIAQGPPGENGRGTRNGVESSQSSSMISTETKDIDVASTRLSSSEPTIISEEHGFGIVIHADSFLNRVSGMS